MGKAAARESQNIQSKVASQSLDMANQSRQQTEPYLRQAGNYYSAVAGGDPANLSAYVAPQVNATRSVYDQARRQVERIAPKGGQRDQALTDLQSNQAGDVSRIMGGGVGDALQRLASLGSGGAQISLSGLGTAGGAGDALGRLAAARGQAIGSAIGGLGSAAGFGLGAKGSSGSPAAAKSPAGPGVFIN